MAQTGYTVQCAYRSRETVWCCGTMAPGSYILHSIRIIIPNVDPYSMHVQLCVCHTLLG